MIRTRLIDDIGAAEALGDEWRDLLSRVASPQLVSTPLWILAWWRQFGDSDHRALRMVAIHEDGVLIGLAPLSIRNVMYRRALPVRRIELLGTGEAEEDEICSDYVGVIAARGRESAVARALADAIVDGSLGSWDEILMSMMSDDDPTVELLRGALVTRGARAEVTSTGTCPHIPLPATWDDYTKSLPGPRRYVVTRAMRELADWAGKSGHSLVRATTRAELAKGRDILHTLHGERWGKEGKAGVFASKRFTRFHDDVMPALLDGVDGGALDLHWLTVKDEPIACIYSYVYGGNVRHYQSGRKIDVPKNVRPGISIHALAIGRAIEEGRAEYDFMNGPSQYKRQLSLATRSLVTLRAVAPSLRARTVDAARTLAERAIAEIRSRRNRGSGGDRRDGGPPSGTNDPPAG